MVGLIIGLAVVYFKPPEIVEKVKTEWKKETLVLPAEIDTHFVEVNRMIEKIKRVSDTVMVVAMDTIFIKDTVRVIKSNLYFEPEEFKLKARVFSLSAVDSAKFSFRMNEDYINDIIKRHSVKPYPEWKKYSWFGAGMLTTAGIVYLAR